MKISLEELKKIIYNLAIKNNALLAILFGSCARGTQTEHSDIDVIFVEETDKPFLKRLDPYFIPLADAVGGGVDVFVYTPEEFKKMKKKFFVKKALQEGVIIFESGKL